VYKLESILMERPLLKHAGLYTDFYELTMAQGWVLSGRSEAPAAFDYFYRVNPFEGGYVLFAGLGDLLEILEHYRFEASDLTYLKSLGFRKEFLDRLKTFRFKGTVWSVREGEVVFPNEPLARVEGTLLECQLIETLLLNILNFQSLIATKASRIVDAAQGRRVVDFGLRRAQGLAGLHASRAAAIGGVEGTSNVQAAALWGLTPTGTQAHSWIQSFPDELSSFRAFAEAFPDNCVLLVDTYDTLKSGVPNAIKVAREMEAKGHKLAGIRLDSGDLSYFSKQSRLLLDQAGFHQVKIIVSNQLDENIVKSLLDQKAPINAFGVGTHLVTAHGSPALDGVYKLAQLSGEPRLKVTENLTKATLPGVKKVVRFCDSDGLFMVDGIQLNSEKTITTVYNPSQPLQKTRVTHLLPEKLMFKMMEKGKRLSDWTVADAAAYARARLEKLPTEHKRFENPHVYRVGATKGVLDLRKQLMGKHLDDLED
jgi:nicotinate phosphoribosyltransferase